jgi:hypothetical protein
MVDRVSKRPLQFGAKESAVKSEEDSEDPSDEED